MFDRCCNNRSMITFEIIHNPQPIPLSTDMDVILKDFLWYVPNIDSYQAGNNELINNAVYSDFAFSYLLQEMSMDEERDVKWIEPNEPFDDDDWNFYEREICCNCQKIIITRQKNLSKTNDLLRCLRNCIAHGHFAVVDEYIIGFNRVTTKSNPVGVKKAVIKIKPSLLLKALKSLSSPRAKELLIGYAFERIGYKVIPQGSNEGRWRPDLIIEKNGNKYAIEIKEYRGQRYLNPEELTRFINESNEMPPNEEWVLLIDTSRVTKATREKEKEIERFRIIDISQVTAMLKENPVDILAL